MSDVVRFSGPKPPPDEPEEEERMVTGLSRLAEELREWLRRLDAEDHERYESVAREVRELRKGDER